MSFQPVESDNRGSASEQDSCALVPGIENSLDDSNGDSHSPNFPTATAAVNIPPEFDPNATDCPNKVKRKTPPDPPTTVERNPETTKPGEAALHVQTATSDPTGLPSPRTTTTALESNSNNRNIQALGTPLSLSASEPPSTTRRGSGGEPRRYSQVPMHVTAEDVKWVDYWMRMLPEIARDCLTSSVPRSGTQRLFRFQCFLATVLSNSGALKAIQRVMDHPKATGNDVNVKAETLAEGMGREPVRDVAMRFVTLYRVIATPPGCGDWRQQATTVKDDLVNCAEDLSQRWVMGDLEYFQFDWWAQFTSLCASPDSSVARTVVAVQLVFLIAIIICAFGDRMGMNNVAIEVVQSVCGAAGVAAIILIYICNRRCATHLHHVQDTFFLERSQSRDTPFTFVTSPSGQSFSASASPRPTFGRRSPGDRPVGGRQRHDQSWRNPLQLSDTQQHSVLESGFTCRSPEPRARPPSDCVRQRSDGEDSEEGGVNHWENVDTSAAFHLLNPSTSEVEERSCATPPVITEDDEIIELYTKQCQTIPSMYYMDSTTYATCVAWVYHPIHEIRNSITRTLQQAGCFVRILHSNTSHSWVTSFPPLIMNSVGICYVKSLDRQQDPIGWGWFLLFCRHFGAPKTIRLVSPEFKLRCKAEAEELQNAPTLEDPETELKEALHAAVPGLITGPSFAERSMLNRIKFFFGNCTNNERLGFEHLSPLHSSHLTKSVVAKIRTNVRSVAGTAMAMKVMPNGCPSEEIRIWRELDHPNIVFFFGCVTATANKEVRLFLELCEKKTLEDDMKRFSTDPVIAGLVVRQLLETARYLHDERHVIHRDWKPANVLRGIDGCYKLTDFGIAAEIGESEEAIQMDTGGTPRYMSPEALKGGAQHYASDIWSVGVMAAEILDILPDVLRSPAVTMFDLLNFFEKWERDNADDHRGCPFSIDSNRFDSLFSDSDLHTDSGSNSYNLEKGAALSARSCPVGEKKAASKFSASNITQIHPRDLFREAMDLIIRCLQHDPKRRPSARDLLHHPFILHAATNCVVDCDGPTTTLRAFLPPGSFSPTPYEQFR